MGDSDAPVVPWDELVRRFKYRQDEHVSLIGPTNTGKTTLARALVLPRRKWVLAFGTKPKDETLTGLLREGFVRPKVPEVPHIVERKPARVLIWPKVAGMLPHEIEYQRATITRAWGTAYRRGGWTMFADEASYLVQELGMRRELRIGWQQGRSNHFGIVAATQRPAWVPRDMYSAATHLFFWNTNDDEDLRRIAGLNGMSSKTVRQLVAGLDRGAHQFLYVNTKTASMVRSVFTPPKRKQA